MSGTPYRLSLKAVVRDERGRVLLLRRSARCKANAGKWELPGGKLDPGETIDEALRREIAEETGLAVHIERVAGAGESARPDMRVAYLFMEARAEAGPVVLSDEHDEYAWLEPEQLPQADLARQYRAFAAEYAARRMA